MSTNTRRNSLNITAYNCAAITDWGLISHTSLVRSFRYSRIRLCSG